MNLPRIALLLACFALAAAVSAQEEEPEQRVLKMRVAVPPLNWGERYWIGTWYVPVSYRNALHERLVKKLHDTGRFIVLERVAMEALLKEQRIAEANTGQSMKGRIVPAQSLVRGVVTDFTLNAGGVNAGIKIQGLGNFGGTVSDARMGINVRIFDVESSELIASEDAYGTARSTSFRFNGNYSDMFRTFQAFEKSPLGEAANAAIDQAVEKILTRLGHRPWTASVAAWDPEAGEVMINAGSEVGVRPGDVFEVHRVSRVVRDPDTGQILGRRTVRYGAVRIIEVEPKFSVAVPLKGEEFYVGDVVREGNRESGLH